MSCEVPLGRSVSIPSGSAAYADLYPSTSSDGALRLGNYVPDFTADSTQGQIHWYDWIEGSWAILFSHPADFTPVCTTEIGCLAIKFEEFARKGVKVATLSADPVQAHHQWLRDVVAHCEQKVAINFPVIADPTGEVAIKYGMLDPASLGSDRVPVTIRAVFIIGPDKKLKLSLNYPASVGRDMDEVMRCVDALQLSAKYSVATPANWPQNHKHIGRTGWSFLLPTVTPEDAKKHFPGYYTCQVPSNRNYLRLTDTNDLQTNGQTNGQINGQTDGCHDGLYNGVQNGS